MDKNIRDTIKQLNELLETDYKLKEFRNVESMLQKNKVINEKISEIKKLQKKSVFLETIKKGTSQKNVDNKVISLFRELEEIPLYYQYKNKKEQLDIELFNIIDYLTLKINEELILSKEEVRKNE